MNNKVADRTVRMRKSGYLASMPILHVYRELFLKLRFTQSTMWLVCVTCNRVVYYRGVADLKFKVRTRGTG